MFLTLQEWHNRRSRDQQQECELYYVQPSNRHRTLSETIGTRIVRLVTTMYSSEPIPCAKQNGR